VKPVLVL